jgi:hypothetical protein
LPSHEPAPQTVPSPVAAQVPCLPGTAQELQAGHAATPQQNPSVQWPLMHSPPAVQAAPFAFRFVQKYPWQLKPLTQSELDAQVVLQASPPQTYGPQLIEVCRQVPEPSHAPTGVAVDPLHDAVPQAVPAAIHRQAPVPSQVPFVPQGGAGWQPPCGSMPPAGTGVHAPALPVTLQARQVPQLAAEQQTPSTQLPLSHSAAAPQICPRRFFPHEPLLQTLPGAQSLSPVHAARQAVPLQA